MERYDLVIIGGGAAGINALKAAVTLEARVVLVDRGPLGGTCVTIDFAPFVDAGELLYDGPWVAERLAGLRDFAANGPRAAKGSTEVGWPWTPSASTPRMPIA